MTEQKSTSNSSSNLPEKEYSTQLINIEFELNQLNQKITKLEKTISKLTEILKKVINLNDIYRDCKNEIITSNL